MAMRSGLGIGLRAAAGDEGDLHVRFDDQVLAAHRLSD